MKRCANLLLLLFLIFISSCGERKMSETIIGEWKVEKVIFPEMDIAPSLLEDFKKEMLSSVYIFKEKGKFELRSNLIPKGTTGIWRAKDETGEIYIEYQAGNNTLKGNYKIEIIDENKIKFKQSLGADLGELEAELARK